MSALRQRLDILSTTDTITPGAMKLCEAVIAKFIHNDNENTGNEKQYTKLVTHLGMAVTRIEREEDLIAPPEDIMQEIRRSPHFPQAVENVRWIESQMDRALPDEERQYLIMHFVNASHL